MVRKRKRQRRRVRPRKINIINMANNSSASGPNPNPPGPILPRHLLSDIRNKSQNQTRRSSSFPRRQPSFDILQNQNQNQNKKPKQQQSHHQEQEPDAGIANQPRSIQDMFSLLPDIVQIVDDDHHNDLIIDLDADDDVELQRALSYSSMISRKQQAPDEEEEVVDLKQKGILRQSFTLTTIPTRSFGTTTFYNSSVTERGDSSVSFMENCVLCNDAKPYDSESLLGASKCGHRFCEDCIKKYVSEKLQESVHGSIMCPGSKCEKPLSGNFWKRLVPERLVEQLVNARTESSVLAQPLLLLCPFEDCSKCFVDDKKRFLTRACPHCWKIFCVRCQVSWHLGMTCAEFQQSLREKEIEREIWGIRLFRALSSGHRGRVLLIR